MILQIKHNDDRCEIINNILDISYIKPFEISIFFESGRSERKKLEKEDMVTIHFVR